MLRGFLGILKSLPQKYCFLILLWTLGGILLLYESFNEFHYAEVVNFSGKVRGGIQRAAKLYLGRDFSTLKRATGEVEEAFKALEVKAEKLKFPLLDWGKDIKPVAVYNCWESLKGAMVYPPSPKRDKRVLEISERCWIEADKITDFYQRLAQRNTLILLFGYFGLSVVSFLIFFYLSLSEQREIKRKGEGDNSLDTLTGVLTREAFAEIFHEINNSPVVRTASLIKLDLDNFKRINETYGVSVGNEVLAKVAHLIKGALRKSDIVARWGGDKFLILLPNTDSEGALRVATKLKRIVESSIFEKSIRVTASFGVTEIAKGEELEEVLLRVSKALYRAKREGGNRIVSYEALGEQENETSD